MREHLQAPWSGRRDLGQGGIPDGLEREHGCRVRIDRNLDGVHVFRPVHLHCGQVAGRAGKGSKDAELVTVPEKQQDRFPKGLCLRDEGFGESLEPGGTGKGLLLWIEPVPEHVGVNGDHHGLGVRGRGLVERIRQPHPVRLVTREEFLGRLGTLDGVEIVVGADHVRGHEPHASVSGTGCSPRRARSRA